MRDCYILTTSGEILDIHCWTPTMQFVWLNSQSSLSEQVTIIHVYPETYCPATDRYLITPNGLLLSQKQQKQNNSSIVWTTKQLCITTCSDFDAYLVITEYQIPEEEECLLTTNILNTKLQSVCLCQDMRQKTHFNNPVIMKGGLV